MTSPAPAPEQMGSPSQASTASGPPAPPTGKPPRILACTMCQQRKIKCDRQFPCANCNKSGSQCIPATPAPARKRKKPNQDLQERLARCEEMLRQYASQIQSVENKSQPQEGDSASSWEVKDLPGKLINEHGNVRFVDGPLATVYEELRAMREMMAHEDTPDTNGNTYGEDNLASFLVYHTLDEQIKLKEIWPEPNLGRSLWQTFLDRVNPLTKIIHVPTMHPLMMQAIEKPTAIPKNLEALALAIFTMAAMSMTPDECDLMFGLPKLEVEGRFRTGAKSALSQINILGSSDLMMLQALILYMISLHGRYNQHSIWIVNGLVIRIAQKLGLHRDGEKLGLSPFETEIRRRLWWQLVILDFKCAMMSGLGHSMLTKTGDVQLPKNLNDSDMDPSATEPFQDREGPTEMIWCLLSHRFIQFVLDMPLEFVFLMEPPTESDLANDSRNTQLLSYRRKLDTLSKDLTEILDKNCDPKAGPVHQFVHSMRDQVVDKLKDILTPPRLQSDLSQEIRSPQDNAFRLAVAAFEHSDANYWAAERTGFRWFAMHHFNMDVFTFMVGQLCHRTEGALVDRAWKQVSQAYHCYPQLMNLADKTNFTLAVFLSKAWKKREQALLLRDGTTPKMPWFLRQMHWEYPGFDVEYGGTHPYLNVPADLDYAPGNSPFSPATPVYTVVNPLHNSRTDVNIAAPKSNVNLNVADSNVDIMDVTMNEAMANENSMFDIDIGLNMNASMVSFDEMMAQKIINDYNRQTATSRYPVANPIPASAPTTTATSPATVPAVAAPVTAPSTPDTVRMTLPSKPAAVPATAPANVPTLQVTVPTSEATIPDTTSSTIPTASAPVSLTGASVPINGTSTMPTAQGPTPSTVLTFKVTVPSTTATVPAASPMTVQTPSAFLPLYDNAITDALRSTPAPVAGTGSAPMMAGSATRAAALNHVAHMRLPPRNGDNEFAEFINQLAGPPTLFSNPSTVSAAQPTPANTVPTPTLADATGADVLISYASSRESEEPLGSDGGQLWATATPTPTQHPSAMLDHRRTHQLQQQGESN